jgi:DNA-binding transcriptional MerR regulator
MATAGDPGAGPQPMLTVAAVARRLGVAPSTLRTWDRRYGLGPSAHTAGSHRRYAVADLARLVVMRRLTGEGVSPAEAAQIATTGGQPDAGASAAGSPLVPRAQDEWEADILPAISSRLLGPRPDARLLGIPAARPRPESSPAHRAAVAAHVGRPQRPGGGRVVALPDASPQARGLARAAIALDTPEVSRLLREAVADHGTVGAWNHLAVPVLRAVGERWTQTGEGVEIEHAFSEALLGVLRGVCCALASARNTRPVLLVCADGDQHTLPLHALAAALAEVEIGCRLLGSGMPPEALVAAVRRTGPAAVFLYARLPAADVEVLELLPRQRPAPRLVVGGPGWAGSDLPASAVLVGSLGEAVDEVRAAVHL